jgi:hypothetical protein
VDAPTKKAHDLSLAKRNRKGRRRSRPAAAGLKID